MKRGCGGCLLPGSLVTADGSKWISDLHLFLYLASLYLYGRLSTAFSQRLDLASVQRFSAARLSLLDLIFFYRLFFLLQGLGLAAATNRM